MGRVVTTHEGVADDHAGGEPKEIDRCSYRASHFLLAKLHHIPNAPAGRKTYRVLVVDDSVLPRAAARTMLGTTAGFRLCGEASSGAEALEAMATLKADLVLMDVHMPELDGA